MRKNFIFFVLIPVVVLLIVAYFFIDRWVESGLEYAGEEIVGARVEIDNLRLSLSPLAVRFTRMQVANPQDTWKNLFETGNVAFAMDAGQLIRGKYIIDNIDVENVILGTRRTTDGALPAGRRRSKTAAGSSFQELAQQAIEKSVEKTPIFDLELLRKGLNVDSLVKAAGLRTPAYIDTLKIQSTAVVGQWNAALTDIAATRTRLQVLDSAIRAIKPSELKSAENILSALTTVDNARTTFDNVVELANTRQASVRRDIDRLSTSIAGIDDIARDDYRRLLSLARLPDVNASGAMEVFLGKQLLHDVTRYLSWIDQARATVAKYQPKPERTSPPRLRGQDIRFPVVRGYPEIWIKNIRLSGGTDSTQAGTRVFARGEIHDISSDQRLAGVPFTLDLRGTVDTSIAASIGARIDRTKDTPLDEYRAQISGITLSNIGLGSVEFLPSTLSHASLTTTIDVRIPGGRFDARTGLGFRNMMLGFQREPRTILERILHEALKGVDGFDANLRLWNTATGLDLALDTDLDSRITSRLQSVAGAELQKIQNEVKARVMAVVAAKRAEFEKVYSQKRQEIEQQIGAVQALIAENRNLLESKKKELQDRLEQEKKGKIDDALKKIFKK